MVLSAAIQSKRGSSCIRHVTNVGMHTRVGSLDVEAELVVG